MKLYSILILFLIFFSGCTDSFDECCKICSTGKACGDSCISKSYVCTKPSGCACNESSQAPQYVSQAPIITTSQIFTLSGIEYISGSETGYINEDGYFNEEKNQQTKFIVFGQTYVHDNNISTSSLTTKSLLEQPSNILRLLITLDTDNYPYNGINISKDFNYANDTKCVDIKMSEDEFKNSNCVNYILNKYSNTNQLVPIETVSDFIQYNATLSN